MNTSAHTGPHIEYQCFNESQWDYLTGVADKVGLAYSCSDHMTKLKVYGTEQQLEAYERALDDL